MTRIRDGGAFDYWFEQVFQASCGHFCPLADGQNNAASRVKLLGISDDQVLVPERYEVGHVGSGENVKRCSMFDLLGQLTRRTKGEQDSTTRVLLEQSPD